MGEDTILSPNQNGMRSGIKTKSAFPFSDKLGELSDKIGSTIDDTISKFGGKIEKTLQKDAGINTLSPGSLGKGTRFIQVGLGFLCF